MTIARMLCLILACAALLLASIANADQPGSQNSSAPPQGSSEAVGGHPYANADAAKSAGTKARTGKHATGKALSHDEAVQGETHSSSETQIPNSTVRVSNDRALTSPVSPASPAQTSTNRGVHARNAATTPNATVSSALPVRPPAITSRSATSSSDQRHLSPNPPVINGATGSKAHNSAALSGTGMHHRP